MASRRDELRLSREPGAEAPSPGSVCFPAAGTIQIGRHKGFDPTSLQVLSSSPSSTKGPCAMAARLAGHFPAHQDQMPGHLLRPHPLPRSGSSASDPRGPRDSRLGPRDPRPPAGRFGSGSPPPRPVAVFSIEPRRSSPGFFPQQAARPTAKQRDERSILGGDAACWDL